LISVSCIALAGSFVLYSGKSCWIYNSSKVNLGRIDVRNGLYCTYTAHPETAAYAGCVKELLTINELHCHLGHVGHGVPQDIVKLELVTGVELDEESKPLACASCEMGKTTRKAITKERVEEQAMEIGSKIHSDLWGPIPTKTAGGRKYYASFTNN
ncbi:hypothetical protein B0H34DRAFT_624834, partial [Crassisporium funariophilum]